MKLIVLGSTGSIGRQSLEVAEHLKLEVVGLSCHRDIKTLKEQAVKFKPDVLAVGDREAGERLKASFNGSYQPKILLGDEGIEELAGYKADTVLVAILGFAAVKPLLVAVQAKRRIALANKEAIVCFGPWLLPQVKELGVELIPVDSEHSAIWQAERVSPQASIKRLYLTASGGPFFDYSKDELRTVTKEEALKHPVWKMGTKITIDSATMMNKGLELIEANRLFAVPEEAIDVLVHREGLIHSMLAYEDGSIMAQLSLPDMRLPIQLALTWPRRVAGLLSLPDFISANFSQLSFKRPNDEVFPALALARRALRMNPLAPTVYNAANEVAVTRFLEGKLSFIEIFELVERVLSLAEKKGFDAPSVLDFNSGYHAMMNLDSWARTAAEEIVSKKKGMSHGIDT